MKTRIEDITTDALYDELYIRAIGYAGNATWKQENGESEQDFEDRLYTAALDAVMDAVCEMEGEEEYDFSSYDDSDVAWYDDVRDNVVQDIMAYMIV